MRILGTLQSSIESLHDVSTELDVTTYVVDDSVRELIPGGQGGIPEQLFVRQDGEDIEIALYVQPEIVSQLEQDNPHERLHGGNLESYCIALEGVSHFVLLTWRAQHGHAVSPLEMELQAEVDKFVGAWLLLAHQGADMVPAARVLSRQLFAAYELREEVQADENERYHVASRVARRFCDGLAERHGRSANAAGIRRDVRQFYRRGLREKLRAA